MSGGKGGSSTTTVEIPEYIEAAAQRNLNKAERISQLGYVPYYGPDVAALTPMQQASMQNVAGAASAFGMATPQGQDIYGMPAPTTFAGGIQGYSSAPMFEQAQAELARQRPAQKSYIDSFFIDPFTGQYGSNVAPMIDYTQIGTMAQAQRDREAADRANELAIAQAQAGAGPQSVYYYNEQDYSTSAPATTYITDASSSITDISQPTTFERIGDDIGEYIVGSTLGRLDPTYGVGEINNPIKNPTVGEMVSTTPAGMEYSPTTGSYVSDGSSAVEVLGGNLIETTPSGLNVYSPTEDTLRPPSIPRPDFGSVTIDDRDDGMVTARERDNFGSDLARSLTDPNYDPPGNVVTRALGITETSDKDSDGQDDSGGGGDGCVVATHAVNSGAFTPSMKREAVVWCMHNLHDKWWGEAIRRGYRHLGRKKIEQGKAHEHYQEFRNYIDFASGKKRTIKGAIHFAARTVQFFAVGLIKGDA